MTTTSPEPVRPDVGTARSPEQIAGDIVGRFSWTSNVSRNGRLVGLDIVVAEAIADAIRTDRREAETERACLERELSEAREKAFEEAAGIAEDWPSTCMSCTDSIQIAAAIRAKTGEGKQMGRWIRAVCRLCGCNRRIYEGNDGACNKCAKLAPTAAGYGKSRVDDIRAALKEAE